MSGRRPRPVCSVDGCTLPHKGLGYCALHYKRAKRRAAGVPEHAKRAREQRARPLFGDGADPMARRRKDVAACPRIPEAEVGRVVRRSQSDAMDVAVAVRDLDPREVWGRIHRLASEDPVRLVAACVALGAMVDVDSPVSSLLAWLEPVQGFRAVVA